MPSWIFKINEKKEKKKILFQYNIFFINLIALSYNIFTFNNYKIQFYYNSFFDND